MTDVRDVFLRSTVVCRGFQIERLLPGCEIAKVSLLVTEASVMYSAIHSSR